MIGALRERLLLQRPESVGGALTFTDVSGAWGQASAEAGRHRFIIRARADVRAGWRLVWGARRFRVVAAFDADDARTELLCEEELP